MSELGIAPEKMIPRSRVNEVLDGIERGDSKRELFQKLSKVANNSRGKEGVVSKTIQKKLAETAEEIHKLK